MTLKPVKNMFHPLWDLSEVSFNGNGMTCHRHSYAFNLISEQEGFIDLILEQMNKQSPHTLRVAVIPQYFMCRLGHRVNP